MKVYELLDKPEKWCKGAYAKNAANEETHWQAPEASSWCLDGALCRCYGNDACVNDFEPLIRNHLQAANIATWNDSPKRTWEDVVKLCRELDI